MIDYYSERLNEEIRREVTPIPDEIDDEVTLKGKVVRGKYGTKR